MERLTLNNVGRGLATALFENELERILENMADTRTSPTKTRKIVLEFAFKPDQQRHALDVEITAKSSIASASGVRGLVFTSLDEHGVSVATLTDPRQLTLADQLKKTREGGK